MKSARRLSTLFSRNHPVCAPVLLLVGRIIPRLCVPLRGLGVGYAWALTPFRSTLIFSTRYGAGGPICSYCLSREAFLLGYSCLRWDSGSLRSYPPPILPRSTFMSRGPWRLVQEG